MYLDANSSSALRPEARTAISSYLQNDSLRNPSSIHAQGRGARACLTDSRKSILKFLGDGKPLEAKLFFTSGGTESCNSLVAGFMGNVPGEIVTSSIEHPAMLEAAEKYAASVVKVPSDKNGIIDVDKFVNAVTSNTAIVSIMAANNETGALQPVAEIAQRLRDRNCSAAIISDCTQAIGKSEISIAQLFDSGVDAIALSGHKLGSLAGIGAVVLSQSKDRCFRFDPLLVGGPQEKRFRAGTENIVGVISLAAVCRKLQEDGKTERERVSGLRDLFWNRISSRIEAVSCLTPGVAESNGEALSNTLLLRFEGVRGDDLVVSLDLCGLSVSTGSACSSGRQDVSPVVLAMGLEKDQGREVVRFSLDWDANEIELCNAVDTIAETVTQMRKITKEGIQAHGY